MNVLDKIEKVVAKYGDRAPITTPYLYFFKQIDGWLWFDNQPDEWTVWLASDKNSHVISNPLYAITIEKSTGKRPMTDTWTGAFKSAITLWPVRGKEEAQSIENLISFKLDKIIAAM